MSENYKFFCNKKCEYFPCHKIPDSMRDKFNCLFCYCPLSQFEDCGGNYTVLENGWKDCSNCTFPHFNYDKVVERLVEITNKNIAKRKNDSH